MADTTFEEEVAKHLDIDYPLSKEQREYLIDLVDRDIELKGF